MGRMLAELFGSPRAHGAFHLQVVMRPPWAIRVADEAPLTLVPIVRGGCWLRPDDEAARELTAGDVLLVRSPTRYALSSALELETQIEIGRDQSCSGSDGRDLAAELSTGLRVWGNDPTGPDRLIVGTYRRDGEVGRLLLGGLPPWLVVSDPAPDLVALLDREISRDEVGQNGVLDRLLDLLLISTLRAWAENAPEAAAWLRAGRDPVVATALAALHGSPHHAWTVQSLARHAGVSRASLAKRFNAAIGSPPMTYLTQWRLALGADLLRTGDTLETIARKVGYGTPFSFSAAFKQQYGMSPQHYRSHAA